ncbi:Sporulation-specific chitinase 2 [Fusarium oxysporum f. sp. albedinis]|nr:Sporulation-specific chitinase 2 [Fusarium oxysporum f. sp. albedinis]
MDLLSRRYLIQLLRELEYRNLSDQSAPLHPPKRASVCGGRVGSDTLPSCLGHSDKPLYPGHDTLYQWGFSLVSHHKSPQFST